MEPLDPYAPPQTENLKPLGSLAQSARGKEISQAKVTLIIIGILTMIVNGFLLFNLPNEIEQAIRQGQAGDPAEVEDFKRAATIAGYLFYGGPLLLGLVFVIFGLIVKKYPLTITITSLVLYIAATVLFAVLNPQSLASGAIVKIIIVVAFCRAIKAAKSYDVETRKAALAGGELLA
jgi:hypothetical protein